MFAVLYVEQCYDNVEGVSCLAAFDTEQEADAHVKKLKNEYDASVEVWMAYLDGFVDSIEVPQNLIYQQWSDYVSQFNMYSDYVTPTNFKSALKNHLRGFGYHSTSVEGFNPPKIAGCDDNLFVVEVNV